jgi:NADH/NAD ratio-sensing transcriptional regulator Rex
MTMATMKRVVIYYLLLELNHGNDHNKESSNLLLTTGAKSWQ